MSADYLEAAKSSAISRFEDLKASLSIAKTLVGEKACVYTTGSFGRLEAGPHSDLDLFIVVNEVLDEKKSQEKSVDVLKPALSNIDEIKLKYHLIEAVENSEIAPFDGDGKFLDSHLFDDFVKYLGAPEDDSRNTFTGRMLLLLESRPLLGEQTYNRLIESIIEKYFRDFEDNRLNFIPAYLMNDILRMWRTFCVNYEFYRRDSEPKYKVKNLKLKFSRMLTCFSAIVYMMNRFAERRTFAKGDALEMVRISPTDRLSHVSHRHPTTAIQRHLDRSLELYAEFLEFAHSDESEQKRRIVDESEAWRKKSQQFGQCVADAIDEIGKLEGGRELHRIVLI